MTVREDHLEAAFLEGGVKIPGLTLRPFSLGTLNLCRRLKLSLFTDDKGDKKKLSDDDSMNQLVVFAWMQSAPLPEVLAHVREGTWEAAVEEFSFGLSVDSITALTGQIARIAQQSAAAVVDVQSKPTEKGGEKDAPPNS